MTAAELIQSLPQRMKKGVAQGEELFFHFDISGSEGGQFTVSVKDGVCTVQSGLSGEPECIVQAKDKVYEDVEMGITNPQTAVLFGKVKISNIPSMMKFVQMFERAI